MQIYKTIAETREALAEEALQKKIGFVPTMGALHKGHLSLVERCHSEYEKMLVGNKIIYYRDQIEDDIENNLNQDTFIEEAKSYLKYTITKPYSNLYNLDSTLLAS